jgi:maleate isomerase
LANSIRAFIGFPKHQRTYRTCVIDALVDAIVQVGTDLVMTQLADEAERWLGKPVIAITAAMLWHALRASGMADQMHGLGSLLRDH